MKDSVLDHMRTSLEQIINDYDFGRAPAELYDPIRYLMSLGGKRLRPLLTLLAYHLYEEDYSPALMPAVALEVFHNFTLMHDDIMDCAPKRRGQPTVHEKWNNNVAILSGDVMLVRAYDLMLEVPAGRLRPVLRGFNACAAHVCEGQQWDMHFEGKQEVSLDQYLKMIKLKTAVLLGFALRLGGLLAGTSEASCDRLYQVGINAGLGFQLKDDLLDVYGESEKFGKQVGGDIIANKKTFLLIKAQELANAEQRAALDQWLNTSTFDPQEKVQAVTAIYDQLGIRQHTEMAIQQYFDQSLTLLKGLQAPEHKKKLLLDFFTKLTRREH
jgi:geranylgeranyl diphosphate synthase type II